MPLSMDANLLIGRLAVAHLFERVGVAVQASMLCVIGFVALLIWLKRPWLAGLAAVVCFTPVAINGMFPGASPVLDLVLGTGLMAIFVVVIARFGLLATSAALTTHFVLLRSPLTLDLSSWRGSIGLLFLGVVAITGFGAVYIARQGKVHVPAG
jgi:hypothetical protein